MDRRLLVIIIIALSMVFIGCEKEEVNHENNDEQMQEKPSYQIKNIDNSGFSVMDTDVVYDLIKDFITSYYKTLREKEEFELSRFIQNPQLIDYIEKKCERLQPV